MKSPTSVKALEDFGRTRLSRTFFMRDFLFSDIAAVHGLPNVPHNPDLAIKAGTRLCEDLLEPLQDRFGRIAVRSAYRSASVNEFGNRNKLNCASNDANAAAHIWDMLDGHGNMGATACIVVPAFWDVFKDDGAWQMLAWWVHDHLPYSEMYFFPKMWAFNLTWNQAPVRRIDSYTKPIGCLTKPGMSNNSIDHRDDWQGIEKAFA
jgi:hypothetical protein